MEAVVLAAEAEAVAVGAGKLANPGHYMNKVYGKIKEVNKG